MAIVRKRDLKALNATDLKAKLAEMEALVASELNAMKSAGRPANAGTYREAKRLKARILTSLTQKNVMGSEARNLKKNPRNPPSAKKAEAAKPAVEKVKA